MTDRSRSKIIEDNPIGKGLNTFRASFNSVCEERRISHTSDALGQLDREDIQNLILDLLSALRNTPAIRLLPSKTGRGTLRSDLLRLISAAASDDFDLDRVKPLLNAALSDDPDDSLIWDRIYQAVTESTPPPRLITSSLQQTPWLHSTSSFANSSEYRKDVDRVLRDELGAIYVGLPQFYKTFFGQVAGLEAASKAVFRRCREGNGPLFNNGWSGWPADANQDDVLTWFAALIEKLATLAEEDKTTPAPRRRPLARPNKPI